MQEDARYPDPVVVFEKKKKIEVKNQPKKGVEKKNYPVPEGQKYGAGFSVIDCYCCCCRGTK
jgi:hypothetical protein